MLKISSSEKENVEKKVEVESENAGPHEPSNDKEQVYDVQDLDPVITNAIRASARTPQEATFLEAVLKRVGVQTFEQRIQKNIGPSIPTPNVVGRSILTPQIALFESDDVELLVNESSENAGWEEIEFEVALDSGSIVNVCHPDDAPGYMLMESAGSKRGQNFVVGDGGRLSNLGEMHLNLSAPAGVGNEINAVASTFQIAKVTRPLMSVGHICDQGLNVIFDTKFAIVKNQSGTEVCRFVRGESGLYTAKMKLRAPAGFGRQGS